MTPIHISTTSAAIATRECRSERRPGLRRTFGVSSCLLPAIVLHIFIANSSAEASPWTVEDREFLESIMQARTSTARGHLCTRSRSKFTLEWTTRALDAAEDDARAGEIPAAISAHDAVVSFAQICGGYSVLGLSLYKRAEILRAFANDPVRARMDLDAALESFRRGGDLANQGNVHLSLALIEGQGDLALARQRNQRALALFVQARDLPGEAKARLRCADVAQSMSDLASARQYAEQALAISQKAGDSRGEGNAETTLARVEQSVGDPSSAERRLLRALGLFVKCGDRTREASVQVSLGVIAQDRQNFTLARQQFELALSTFTAARAVLGQALASQHLGRLDQKMGNLKDAQNHYEAALALMRKVGQISGQVHLTLTLGRIALANRDPGTAMQKYEEALALAQKAGSRRDEASVRMHIGELSLKNGEARKARVSMAEASRLFQKVGDIFSAWNAAYLETVCNLKLNIRSDARESLQKALALAMELRSKAGQGADRRGYQEQMAADMKAIILLCAETDPAFALFIREQFMGRTFLETLSIADALAAAGVSKQDRERREVLADQHGKTKGHLLQLMRSGRPESDPEVLAAEMRGRTAQKELESFEAGLASAYPRFAELKRPKIPEPTAALRALTSDEAILIFLFGVESSGVWLVDSSGSIEFARLPVKGKDAAAFAESARKALQFQNLPESSSNLTKEILLPVLGRLGKEKYKILLVPDGALGTVPLAALPYEGRTLGDRFLISYVPSLAVLYKLRGSSRAFHPRIPVIAFGGAYYRRGSAPPASVQEQRTGLGFREAGLADLPDTRAEIEDVRRLYYGNDARGAAFIFGGPFASEQVLKALNAGMDRGPDRFSLKDVRVIHFAAHARAEARLPETSRLILSNPALISGEENAAVRKRFPAFEKEDGSVLAAEVIALQLSAEIVVLSACQTGLGEITGTEGVVGLTQAWMIAGAKGVLVSLWDVSDFGTRVLMHEFHSGLVRGLDPRNALAGAQRALRDGKWRHGPFSAAGLYLAPDEAPKKFSDIDLSAPYYWAGFQYWGK